ncbi:hypothetical protein [Methylocystis iwaonis]|uniref:hypothetical protein n=1 Tax=Methylocystis iwaonis TaxID=2885079 RepID=UPI002E7AFF5A|nr:hypothetical protein [Methylocystis iwaonis]
MRAGLAGVMTAIDYRAALAMAPCGIDLDAFKVLLLRAESGLLSGLAKLGEKADG